MEYVKRHLSYAEQLERMRARGLVINDDDEAMNLLRRIGYYRLSAYTYPFRQLIGEDEARDTRWQHRHPEFVEGARLDDAVALLRFDQKLREVMARGLEAVELAVRVRIAYHLGQEDSFGHVDLCALDPDAASVTDDDGRTAFDKWVEKYDRLLNHAKGEDYISHYLVKYGGRPPIWISVEFLDFGALCWLFSMLPKRMQSDIAQEFGVLTGPAFAKWLRGLNVVRNHCAHHGRLWNRRLVNGAGRFSPKVTGAELHHVPTLQNAYDRVYPAAAITAYLHKRMEGRPQWPMSFRTVLSKAPHLEQVDVLASMGAPTDWKSHALWN